VIQGDRAVEARKDVESWLTKLDETLSRAGDLEVNPPE